MKRRLRKCFVRPLQIITGLLGLFLASIYDFEFEAIPLLILIFITFIGCMYILSEYTDTFE